MDDLFLAAFEHIPVPPDINEREAINANHVRVMDEMEAERRRNLLAGGDGENVGDNVLADNIPADEHDHGHEQARHQGGRRTRTGNQTRRRGRPHGDDRRGQRTVRTLQQPNRPVNPNPITYQQMVEGVVDQSVGSKYVNEILLLMDWAFSNQQDWLCDTVLAEFPTVNRQMIDENYTQSRKRIKEHYTTLLRNAKNIPVFALEKITVQRFMEYLASQAHYITGRVLKSGSYGTKRSAFRHMFRLHNGQGFPTQFEGELSIAWRGFMRTMAKQNAPELSGHSNKIDMMMMMTMEARLHKTMMMTERSSKREKIP